MNAQRFTLSVCFPESEVTVSRLHANASDAKKWGQLCLDICGKDERGRLFIWAELLDAEGASVKQWVSREVDRLNAERHPYVTMQQWAARAESTRAEKAASHLATIQSSEPVSLGNGWLTTESDALADRLGAGWHVSNRNGWVTAEKA